MDERGAAAAAMLGVGDVPAFLALDPAAQFAIAEKAVSGLDENRLRNLVRHCASELARPFLPLPGPQAMALCSTADITGYGGAAGGGKTHLIVGAAGEHRRGAIFRREITELDGIIAAIYELYGKDDYNKNEKEHDTGERSIKLGGMKEAEDWRHYAGRARDYYAFDEAAEFLEEQVRTLVLAWMRSPDPAQRCRAILAFNPPRGPEGEWVLRWFAPWIDPAFPDPAAPGELRWAVFPDKEVRWVDGPGEVAIDDKTYSAVSLTFVPAKLKDNAFQDQASYRARLSNLPEPLRSQLIEGNFLAGRQDDAWQIVPSDWIKAAQARWRPDGARNAPMTAIGADVAQGGPDRTVLAPRHDWWFAPLKVLKGVDTKDGPAVAGQVLTVMRDGCTVAVDVSGGWGSGAYAHLLANLGDDAVVAVMFGVGVAKTSRDGQFGFLNVRAWLYWNFRELLDPNYGVALALPPEDVCPGLAAELAMARYRLNGRTIQVEDKKEIIHRLGRSPDEADAVVMSAAYGDERAAERLRPTARQAVANLGYAQQKLHVIPGGRDGAGRQTVANLGSRRIRA